jgi:ketosteroid isomerase-like protein
MDNDPARTVRRFVEAINARSPARVAALLSEDHLFVDSSGETVRGREEMRKAWIGYFVMIPDYAIELEHLFVSGSTVAVFGRARGTYAPDGTLSSQNRWELSAAWRAEVRDGLIQSWQVYADNEPVRQIMARYG